MTTFNYGYEVLTVSEYSDCNDAQFRPLLQLNRTYLTHGCRSNTITLHTPATFFGFDRILHHIERRVYEIHAQDY